MIIDASVVLQAFFPDEAQARAQGVIRDHVTGVVPVAGPTLLEYEVVNAVLQAVRRQRIREEEADGILQAFEGLGIALEPVPWQSIVTMARRFDSSGYDATYLALAELRDEPLVTGDLRLYRAVSDHLSWVRWSGDETHLVST